MIVYAEFLNSLNTAINQPQPMLFATCEAEFGQASVVDAGTSSSVAGAVTTCKVHFSVDQVIVRWWSNKVLICKISPYNAFEDGEVVFVVVVVERYRAKIDVVFMM